MKYLISYCVLILSALILVTALIRTVAEPLGQFIRGVAHLLG